MLKVLFYVLFGWIGLLGLYFVLTSLFGHFSLWNAHPLAARLVLVVAAALAARILYWAYELGELQGRLGAGIGVVLLAVVAFQLVMMAGALVFGRKGG